MSNLNFTCPYCSHPTTITDPNYFENWVYLDVEESNLGKVGLKVVAINCPNNECNQLYLKVLLTKSLENYNQHRESSMLQQWQLLPESEAKVLPDYIPKPVQEDYYQACRIRDLSPKASATLARRCIQGMIRDFYGISKPTLQQEINALEEKVDPLVWEAIDAVRSVGNIGAHMEKDINLIVDVDPDEAQLLIGLIEQLIEDWYIQRKNQKDRLIKIKKMAEEKKQAKKESKII